MKLKIGIINLEINNIKNVNNFFSQFGKVTIINESKDLSVNIDILVIPGNGHFKTGIRSLQKKNFFDTIINFADHGKKIIGICLGMQLLLNSSEESINDKGLGIIKGRVLKIKTDSLKLPLIGWYDLNSDKNEEFKKKSFFFNNSFACYPADDRTIYYYLSNKNNLNINAILKYNNIYGLQFHPEKSSKNGYDLIQNILNDRL